MRTDAKTHSPRGAATWRGRLTSPVALAAEMTVVASVLAGCHATSSAERPAGYATPAAAPAPDTVRHPISVKTLFNDTGRYAGKTIVVGPIQPTDFTSIPPQGDLAVSIGGHTQIDPITYGLTYPGAQRDHFLAATLANGISGVANQERAGRRGLFLTGEVVDGNTAGNEFFVFAASKANYPKS